MKNLNNDKEWYFNYLIFTFQNEFLKLLYFSSIFFSFYVLLIFFWLLFCLPADLIDTLDLIFLDRCSNVAILCGFSSNMIILFLVIILTITFFVFSCVFCNSFFGKRIQKSKVSCFLSLNLFFNQVFLQFAW